MNPHHLDETKGKLKGPTIEQIIVFNQWAAVALDKFHQNSTARYELSIDAVTFSINLQWDSSFSKAAMKEKIDSSHHGAVGLAMFVMSVLLDYGYVEQTEIGDGVDYRFMKSEPNEDDLNFMDTNHFVEISGLLEEKGSNTLDYRIKEKHTQIDKGAKRDEPSSVLVTLFSQPRTVKAIHK